MEIKIIRRHSADCPDKADRYAPGLAARVTLSSTPSSDSWSRIRPSCFSPADTVRSRFAVVVFDLALCVVLLLAVGLANDPEQQQDDAVGTLS
jgi:hypothetical protein